MTNNEKINGRFEESRAVEENVDSYHSRALSLMLTFPWVVKKKKKRPDGVVREVKGREVKARSLPEDRRSVCRSPRVSCEPAREKNDDGSRRTEKSSLRWESSRWIKSEPDPWSDPEVVIRSTLPTFFYSWKYIYQHSNKNRLTGTLCKNSRYKNERKDFPALNEAWITRWGFTLEALQSSVVEIDAGFFFFLLSGHKDLDGSSKGTRKTMKASLPLRGNTSVTA